MAQRSYAITVRDAILDRIKAMDWFTPFTFSTNKSLQIQPQSIPFCGVYLIEETGLPDGDPNVAETRFRTSARYGFSVIVMNNNAEQAEYALDAAYQLLTNGLFNDESLYDNPAAKIQAFVRESRSHQFGSIGADNELPIAELRFDLTCDLGVITYPPIVMDRLETLHIETIFPIGGSDTEQAAIQQVKAEYDVVFWSQNIVSRARCSSKLIVNAEVI